MLRPSPALLLLLVSLPCLSLAQDSPVGRPVAESEAASDLRTKPDPSKNELYLLELSLRALRVVPRTELPWRVYMKKTATDGTFQLFMTGREGKLATPETYFLAQSTIHGDRLGGMKDRFYKLSPAGTWRRVSERAEVWYEVEDRRGGLDRLYYPPSDDDYRPSERKWSGRPADDVVVTPLGIKLALIPAGEFVMGPRLGEHRLPHDQGTTSKRTVARPFYLGTCEVTQRQWQDVMGTTPWDGVHQVHLGPGENDDHAAICISWEGAREFCRRLSAKEHKTYRLPSETEWEYACRSGSTTAYFFGDDAAKLAELAWFDGNAATGEWGYLSFFPRPVGEKRPNAWGLHDMAGNVWEWCEDSFDPEQTLLPENSGPVRDPAAKYRVLRGGSWHSTAEYCRSAARSFDLPSRVDRYYGFRVVRER